MHIAYLTGRYPQVSHTFIHREVDALRDLGHSVTTYSIWRTGDDQILTDADRREREATLNLLPLKPVRTARAFVSATRLRRGRIAATFARAQSIARKGVRGRILALLWAVEAIVLWDDMRRKGARHVHAHINGTAPTVAMLVAFLGNDPDTRSWTWSLTVHGPAEFYDVEGEALAEKVRDADAVVAISDFARSQLMALVEEDHWRKIEIVHCGVAPEVFEAAPPPHADERLAILNVSRLAPTKGNAMLIEAMAELKRRGVDAHATIVGDGERRDALERHAAACGVDDRVTFAGAVGQDRIRDFYAAADVFCLPSFAEGVPVVLMEAMAMRRPVVATTIMGVAELVEHRVGGMLVPPARVDLLADTLEELARDPELRRRLGDEGRRKVVEEFSITTSAARLDAIFRRLSAAPGQSAQDTQLAA